MEFLNVMLKVWMKYWNLFLQGLGMTLFMGSPHPVLISTVFRFSDGTDAPQQRGHRKI